MTKDVRDRKTYQTRAGLQVSERGQIYVENLQQQIILGRRREVGAHKVRAVHAHVKL